MIFLEEMYLYASRLNGIGSQNVANLYKITAEKAWSLSVPKLIMTPIIAASSGPRPPGVGKADLAMTAEAYTSTAALTPNGILNALKDAYKQAM